METVNKIVVSRKFNCPPAELFDWLIRPALIAQWFGPKHLSIGAVKTDIRVGGNYTIELLNSAAKSFFIKGKYIEISKPYRLVFTFHYFGLPSAPPDSFVKIKLETIAQNQSLLTLSQDFKHKPSDMDSRTNAWEHMLQKLETLTTK